MMPTDVQADPLEIRQIRLSRMATFCYLVGDRANGKCALIDPAFDTVNLLKEAESHGYSITHVINTHGHPDHVAGNADILRATGAQLMIHRADADRLRKILNRSFARLLGGGGSPCPDRLLDDGDRIRIGDVQLAVLHTPGHTPGGICLYTKGHVMTGDTLFVGGVGRTDFPGGSMKTLVRSIREKIFTLPDETIIWPGHDYGAFPYSTAGREKRSNPYTR